MLQSQNYLYTAVMDNDTLVNRLRNYMEYIGLSNTQFADRAGIPRPTLSQILSGRNKKINNELIDKLHSAFPRLSIIWLLFGEGPMDVDIATQNMTVNGPENRTDASERTIGSNDATVETLNGNVVSDYEEPGVYGLPRSAPPQASLFDSERESIYHRPYSVDRKSTPTPNRPAESKQPPRAETTVPRVERMTPTTETDGRKVVSIMVFYSDNSFEVFKPEQTE